MTGIAKKTVLVQVVYPDERTRDYELTFKSSAHVQKGDQGDIAMIKKELCSKSPDISNFIENGGFCEFLKESVLLFPGRWTHVGDNSPIKHQTVLRCALSKRKILSLDGDDDESQGETQNSRLSKSKKVMLIDNYCSNDKDQLSGNAHTIMLEVTRINFFIFADGTTTPDRTINLPSRTGKKLKATSSKSTNKTSLHPSAVSDGNITDSDFETLPCKFLQLYLSNFCVLINDFFWFSS